LQRCAHVREAVGKEKRGRDGQKKKKKEFHVGSDNGCAERFKATGRRREANAQRSTPDVKEGGIHHGGPPRGSL
jgi:hypothetical protein